MTKRYLCSSRQVLVAILIVCLAASVLRGVARADERGGEKQFRVPATAFSPIGKVYSLGGLSINGRRVYGEQMIWNGELVSVGENGANVSLDRLGIVSLFQGTSVRLLTSTGIHETYQIEPTLCAIVVSGVVAVALRSDAVAQIEVGNWVITSSRGSKFRVAIVAGELSLVVERGEVSKSLQQPEPTYIMVGAKPGKRPPIVSTQNRIKAEVKKVALIPVLVRQQPSDRPARRPEMRAMHVAYQVTPAATPAPSIEVEFCLGNYPAVGSFDPGGTRCVRAFTHQDGVATAQFRAGSDDKIRSTVSAVMIASPKTRWDGDIELFKVPWFLRPRNIAILAAVAGGGVVCAFKCGPGGPLRQVPPPVIP